MRSVEVLKQEDKPALSIQAFNEVEDFKDYNFQLQHKEQVTEKTSTS